MLVLSMLLHADSYDEINHILWFDFTTDSNSVV